MPHGAKTHRLTYTNIVHWRIYIHGPERLPNTAFRLEKNRIERPNINSKTLFVCDVMYSTPNWTHLIDFKSVPLATARELRCLFRGKRSDKNQNRRKKAPRREIQSRNTTTEKKTFVIWITECFNTYFTEFLVCGEIITIPNTHCTALRAIRDMFLVSVMHHQHDNNKH